MVTSLETPQERLSDLTADVDRLEAAFADQFAQWEKLNFASAAHYFQSSYAGVIGTLARISAEEERKDADTQLQPHLQALFQRSVKLLGRSVRYVNKAKTAIWPVHKMLLLDLARFDKRHDINGLNGLLKHLVKMTYQLTDNWPPAREAWTADGSDLKPDEEFEAVFQRFLDLDKKITTRTQDDYELYARRSWVLLFDACRALHIPGLQVEPGEDFFNNETRPTYVDYPQDSKEFLYGQGNRPGILTVKSNIGGPLLDNEARSIRHAKKRTAPPAPQGANKRPRTERGYAMTLINATADLEDALRDSRSWSARDEKDIPARPGADRLVTPTCENRRQLLAAYREETRAIADELYGREFKMPMTRGALPQTAEARAMWVWTAAEKVRAARAAVNLHIDDADSPAKAKQLRLSAYKLKLARALYMVGVLSGSPAASREEVRNALRDRLSDWILHERAWTAGDQYLLSRARLTTETAESLRANIRQRDDNIWRWSAMYKELDEETDNAGENDNDDNKNAKDDASQPQDPSNPRLTPAQIDSANKVLRRALNPALPGSGGDYARDVREEGRRRAFHSRAALARLRREPVPAWGYRKIADPFAAGGPPGWRELPRRTVWERLQFMWVLAFWRLYQLRELEP